MTAGRGATTVRFQKSPLSLHLHLSRAVSPRRPSEPRWMWRTLLSSFLMGWEKEKNFSFFFFFFFSGL